MCLTRDYKEIPQRSLIEDCALEHAINFDALNECATKDDGSYGIGMLRASVRRSSDVRCLPPPHQTTFPRSNVPLYFQAGVTKSCTVRLNNEIYCIRDNHKWTDCPSGAAVNDLVIAVEKLYRSHSS